MNTRNILQVFFCLVWLTSPLTGHASPIIQTDPQAVGAWSSGVNDVQGRLLFAIDGKVNGTTMTRIYLELRNVSDTVDPLKVDYGTGEGLRLEVVDSRSKKVAPDNGDAFDAMIPGPLEVTLPHDSSLRFLISVSGYGIPKDGGMMLELSTASQGPILLPSESHETYFLQGTFSVAVSKKLSSWQRWHGMLTLPPVRIPQ